MRFHCSVIQSLYVKIFCRHSVVKGSESIRTTFKHINKLPRGEIFAYTVKPVLVVTSVKQPPPFNTKCLHIYRPNF